MKKIILLFAIIVSIFIQKVTSQNLYFPPLNPSATWDTISPSSLGWCTDNIDSLYSFLQSENTKGFILLKMKIVLEKYFGTFTKDSVWYWASAGKTITSFLIGKAQEEGYLKISDTTTKYLGKGWTSCTPAQEAKITIWNQITMTTGLDDGVPDNHCTLPSCLIYKADAGTRWAYHNAPYSLLEKVITTATGQTKNNYTQSVLKAHTGMTGTWLTTGYDNVFYSKVRSMARYGLLAQNRFIWNKDTLLNDTAYIKQMTNTSQLMNYSYGYLWWLNGKQSYMLPSTQFVFPGAYAPDAPSDMFAGLGKNGQIVSISRSKGLVVVRMGNSTNNSEVSSALCNQIWQKLNDIMCLPVIEGYVNYDNTDSTKLSNVEVYLYNSENKIIDSTSTNTLGYYKFSKIQNGNYKITAKSNNQVKEINPIDALLVNRYYIKLFSISDPVKLFAADASCDFLNPPNYKININPIDALMINRKYIKVISNFKENWYFELKQVNVKAKDVSVNLRGICTGDVNASYK